MLDYDGSFQFSSQAQFTFIRSHHLWKSHWIRITVLCATDTVLKTLSIKWTLSELLQETDDSDWLGSGGILVWMSQTHMTENLYMTGIYMTLKYAKLSKITSFLPKPAGVKLFQFKNRLESRLWLRFRLWILAQS